MPRTQISEERIRKAAEDLVLYQYGRSTKQEASDAGFDMKIWQDGSQRVRGKAPRTAPKEKAEDKKTTGQSNLPGKRSIQSISLPKEASAKIAAKKAVVNRIVKLKSGVADVKPESLKLDPSRFQYKLVHGETGTSGSLTGVGTWDSNLAGIVQVWQDPSDGETYVINGHNRVNLAKKLSAKEMTVKYIKATSPEEARAIGALTNIAEGRGNALDAAKFFRDTGLTVTELQKKGIPLKEKIATDGLALSQLNEGLFNRVAVGDMPLDRGIAIGAIVENHKQQSELINLIDQQEKKGRKINQDTIKELAVMVADAPKKDEDLGFLGMLGFEQGQQSLAVEKADLQSDIKRRLSREKKLFSIVSKSKSVEQLEKAGNKINVDSSKNISDQAEIALRIFDQEKNLSGEISAILNNSARRIGNGEPTKAVREETYRKVVGKIQETFKRGKK